MRITTDNLVVQSQEIASHSKNPTYVITIDNRLTLLKQALNGDLSVEEFREQSKVQEIFVKAYSSREESEPKKKLT